MSVAPQSGRILRQTPSSHLDFALRAAKSVEIQKSPAWGCQEDPTTWDWKNNGLKPMYIDGARHIFLKKCCVSFVMENSWVIRFLDI